MMIWKEIIYYHIAIQQIEQLNKQSIFIKLDHYHMYKNHRCKCPYVVEETNKPEILRHQEEVGTEKRVNVFRAINKGSKET